MAFGSFSIREYALKMRSVDAEKSYPFVRAGKELKREEIEALLPPIVCRKYRWWSDELEIARSGEETKLLEKPETEVTETAVLENTGGLGLEKLQIEETEAILGADEDLTAKICPVCGTFTASTINAVNAHIDSCLAQASREERRKLRMESVAKAKWRMPKKRSIVEIFAVAPQIERLAYDEEDEEDEEVEEEKIGEERMEDSDALKSSAEVALKAKNRKKKLKKESIEMIMKSKKKKKKKKKILMMKKKHRSGNVATKKDKVHKLKLSSSIDYSEFLQASLHNKRSVKEIANPVVIQKKKSSKIKGMPKKNQLRPKASQLGAQKQGKPIVFPVHGILKNQTGLTSAQIPSATGHSLGSILMKHQRIRHSEKHVRFSGKDDILGHAKKWCSNELPQIHSLHDVLSDAMDDPSMKDQSVTSDQLVVATDEALDVNGSDKDDALIIVNEGEARSLHEEKQLAAVQSHFVPTTVIGCNSRSCHEMEKASLGEFVDLNQDLQQCENLHLSSPDDSISHNFSGIPNMINAVPKEGINCRVGVQAEGSLRKAPHTSRGFLEPFAFPISRPAAISSLANTSRNVTSRPLLSCSATNMETNEQQPYPLQSMRLQNLNDSGFQCQPLSHLSQKDLISSIYSSSSRLKETALKNVQFGEARAITDTVSVCRDRTIIEDFVGLPLNSQGELVQLHSNNNAGFSQLFKKQNMTMASVGSYPVCNLPGPMCIMDQSNMKEKLNGGPPFPILKRFPVQKYLKENTAMVPASSRSGLTELEVTGRQEAQCHDAGRETTCKLGLEMDLMNISSHSCREYNQSDSHSERENSQVHENVECGFQPSAQTTMRLMGKNVIVGGSNKEGQGMEDGKIWTDKEIITEQRPTSTICGNPAQKQGFQPERIVKPVSGMSKEIVSCSTETPSLLQLTMVEPRLAQANLHPHPQTHLMSFNGLPLVDGKQGANFHPYSNQFPPQALLHMASTFPESFSSGTESVKTGCSFPMPLSDLHKPHLERMLLNSGPPKHDQNPAYTATVPFFNQDRGVCTQSTWAQKPSPSLPRWLQNATQLKETPYSSLPHPAPSTAKHQPCTISGTDLLPLPSPYVRPSISFPAHDSNSSNPYLQNPGTPATLACHSLIPALPGFRSTSVIGTSFRNRSKMRERTSSRSTCSKDLDAYKNVKKRPATKTVESMKPMKKSNLEIQKDPNASTGLQMGEFLHGCTRYSTGALTLYAHGDKPVTETKKDEARNTSGVNSFKLDSVTRSGPIKLSAGAKHILKPSQNLNQDNSRPTHSTIPFAMVADSDKISDFQKKTAKIYRF